MPIKALIEFYFDTGGTVFKQLADPNKQSLTEKYLLMFKKKECCCISCVLNVAASSSNKVIIQTKDSLMSENQLHA